MFAKELLKIFPIHIVQRDAAIPLHIFTSHIKDNSWMRFVFLMYPMSNSFNLTMVTSNY